jgi:hypothetical protein
LQPEATVDIVILSDTHELHREVEVPAGGLLVCCGDFSMFSKSLAAIEDFNDWLGELPHRHRLVVFGNHEFYFEADPARRSLITNATVLVDEAITIDGLKIYGSPITPLYGGAFGKSNAEDTRRHWRQIPDDTNLLITHGPPHMILDRSPGQREHAGDPPAPPLLRPRSRRVRDGRAGWGALRERSAAGHGWWDRAVADGAADRAGRDL